MGTQEIIAYILVAIAAVFLVKKLFFNKINLKININCIIKICKIQ